MPRHSPKCALESLKTRRREESAFVSSKESRFPWGAHWHARVRVDASEKEKGKGRTVVWEKR